jgi:aminoglycoside 3-N-acetyltransferase
MLLTKELICNIVAKGDRSIYLATDIKRFSLECKKNGEAFNPNTFIDDLKDALLPEQSLIIPAFTDTLKNGEEFDAVKSKPTIGALPNRVFRRKDYFRTDDPLHSAFIYGPFSELDFEAKSTFGENSLFHNLLKNNVVQVFFDVDLQNSFTFIHYVEELKAVAYRQHYSLLYKQNGIQKKRLFHTRKPGYITNLSLLQTKMLANGILQKAELHGMPVYRLETQEAFDFLLAEIAQHGGKEWRYFSWKAYFRRWLKRILKNQAF